MADPVVAHGVAQGQADVLLPEHLGEALRAEAPVEGLVRASELTQVSLRERPPRAAYRWAVERRPGSGRSDVRCSVRRPGLLRHTDGPAESCCLPALTRFTGARCAGPGRRTEHRAVRSRR